MRIADLLNIAEQRRPFSPLARPPLALIKYIYRLISRPYDRKIRISIIDKWRVIRCRVEEDGSFDGWMDGTFTMVELMEKNFLGKSLKEKRITRNILIINFVDATSVRLTRFNEQISRKRIPTSCSTSFNESKSNIFEFLKQN